MKDRLSHFRADAHLIGQLIKVDNLRYTSKNIASLITVFAVPVGRKESQEITVRFIDDAAENLSKENPVNQWFEVKGKLHSTTNKDLDIQSPVFLLSERATPLPNSSLGFVKCEIIGRLTKEPEEIEKTNDFKFGHFSLAVNRKSTDKAQFFHFSIFRPKLLEQAQNELTKGSTIFAAGDLAFYRAGKEQKLNYSIKLDRYLLFEEHSASK